MHYKVICLQVIKLALNISYVTYDTWGCKGMIVIEEVHSLVLYYSDSIWSVAKLVRTSYKFLDKNTGMYTLSGLKVALNDNTTFPAVLKSLFEVQLVAHIHKYFCAAFPRYWGISMVVLFTTIMSLSQNLIYWLISNSILLC